MYEIKIIDCPNQGKTFYHIYLNDRLVWTTKTYLEAFDWVKEQGC